MNKFFKKKSSKIFTITMFLLILLQIIKENDIPFWGFLFWGILLVGFVTGAFVAEKE